MLWTTKKAAGMMSSEAQSTATDSFLSMTAKLQRQGMKTSQENEAQSETGLWHPLPFSEVGGSIISERGPMIRLSGQSTSLTNLLA